MLEVFGRPDHVGVWHQAALGHMPDWDALFTGYGAAVDWPAAAFWQEMSDAYPDARILLSTRDSAGWWRSCDSTIFEVFRKADDTMPAEWTAMINELFRSRFAGDTSDRATAIAAYERHNQHVRATAPADRLVEWQPGDGWAPLCDALGVAIPDEPFPHVNTTAEFRAMVGLDT
jgi:hypothetical protein